VGTQPQGRSLSEAIQHSRFNIHNSSFPAFDALLLFFILNLALQPLVEPDFGWHLRAGLDLLKQGWAMPATDPYSHTMPDWPWVEHAWLMDGLLGLLYEGLDSAGPLAVILLFAVITIGAFETATGLAHIGIVQAGRTQRLLAVAGALWVSLPFLGARTQLVTLLGLACLLRLYGRYLAGQLRSLWVLPPLFLLWANVHGGFTAGLFVLTLTVTASVILRLALGRWPSFAGTLDEPVLTWGQIGHLTLVIVISVLVTLLNPYGWRLYSEIYASLNDKFMIDVLHEWQPVSLSSQAGVTYVGYLGGLGLALMLFYRRVEPVRWSLLAFFLVQSLLHWRNVLFFVLLSVPLWAELLAVMTKSIAGLMPDGQRQKQAVLGVTLGMALWMSWLGPDHLQRVVQCGLSPEEFFRATEYPIEAVQWIRTHRDRLGAKLYNDYGWGGFLLWRLPGEKIFIDGRMPAWRIGDRWIFYDYVALTSWDPPELRVLDKYGVDWAIVGRNSPLDDALAQEQDWREVYGDPKVTIYVRRKL
jgi:hypothetical protein